MESIKIDWKSNAEKCFFQSHMSIEDTAAYVGVSRQSVSGYLKSLPGYAEEKESRKARNQEKRKEYKKEKNREYRAMSAVTTETMRREHDIAALILSREKYH